MKIVNFFKKIIKPTSENKDKQRVEFILNTLLIGSVFLSFSATIIVLINLLNTKGPIQGEISLFALMAIFIIFSLLYFLSRKKFLKTASYGFIFVYLIINTIFIIKWGIELPTALIFYSLIIVMAGILINSRFAFAVAIVISVILYIASYLQSYGLTNPNLYWKQENQKISDITIFSIVFFVVSLISWLSNTEIEKSLKRARESEADLKKERDLLEIKVEQRTKKIQIMQIEKLKDTFRLAEFGQLSAGLFHDLANSLNAVSLSLEEINSHNEDEDNNNNGNKKIKTTKLYLQNALSATKKMGDFIITIKRQLKKEEKAKNFLLKDEIETVLKILKHKAIIRNIRITPINKEGLELYGDLVKFDQIILNLLSNAIDAYNKINKEEKEIIIKTEEEKNKIKIIVEDFGSGISDENLTKIFDPFFTTKSGENTGIGLFIIKNIIEKEFNGTINAESRLNFGTKFTVTLPQKQYEFSNFNK